MIVSFIIGGVFGYGRVKEIKTEEETEGLYFCLDKFSEGQEDHVRGGCLWLHEGEVLRSEQIR